MKASPILNKLVNDKSSIRYNKSPVNKEDINVLTSLQAGKNSQSNKLNEHQEKNLTPNLNTPVASSLKSLSPQNQNVLINNNLSNFRKKRISNSYHFIFHKPIPNSSISSKKSLQTIVDRSRSLPRIYNGIEDRKQMKSFRHEIELPPLKKSCKLPQIVNYGTEFYQMNEFIKKAEKVEPTLKKIASLLKIYPMLYYIEFICRNKKKYKKDVGNVNVLNEEITKYESKKKTRHHNEPVPYNNKRKSIINNS